MTGRTNQKTIEVELVEESMKSQLALEVSQSLSCLAQVIEHHLHRKADKIKGKHCCYQ